jgi:hypothetical protein
MVSILQYFNFLYFIFFSSLLSFCFIFIFVSLPYEVIGKNTFFASKRNDFRFHFVRFAS